MKKTLWRVSALALLAAGGLAHAQSTPATPSASSTPSTPAKKELVAKMVQLQQPASENLARQLAEGPVLKLMQQVGPALQFRVAPEKREALGKDIQGDIKKYADETVPMLRERAVKLAPSIVGPLLEERFSEEELKQLVAFLESPVQKKLAQLNVDIQKGMSEKLVADTRGAIEPKYKAMEASVTQRVTQAISASATPPAKPASK